MQIKTIQKAISQKMEEWIATITDKVLAEDVRDNLLVSGGSITSMLLNETVNDFDVYLMDMDVCKRLAEYYIKPFIGGITLFDGREKDEYISVRAEEANTSWDISIRNLKDDQIKLYFNNGNAGLKINNVDKTQKYQPTYFSPNAISLTNDLQIVLRFWGNAEQIHKTFDYIHATNYYTTKEGLVRNLAAMESILTKQLKYQGSYYPLTSIIRAKKFIKRGFNISAGELLKIMYQISQLDLENPDVLEEQLIGVDVAYFSTLISILRNKYKEDSGFKLNVEYLTDLIDKVFDGDHTYDN